MGDSHSYFELSCHLSCPNPRDPETPPSFKNDSDTSDRNQERYHDVFGVFCCLSSFSLSFSFSFLSFSFSFSFSFGFCFFLFFLPFSWRLVLLRHCGMSS